MTLDTYSHVIPALHAEAAKQLNTLLTQAKKPVAVTVAVNEANVGKGASEEMDKPALEAGL